MGRLKRFDPTTVLEQTLALFWSRGFAASSVRQLEEVTDLHPGSLYHQFQSKEGLYLAVLRHYIDHKLTLRLHNSLATNPPLDGLRRFFTSGYRNPKDEQYQNCCFLACATTELHLLPIEAKELINTGLEKIEQALDLQLQKAQQKAMLQKDINTRKTAQELVVFFLGLQLKARLQTNQRTLDNQVVATLQQVLSQQPPS